MEQSTIDLFIQVFAQYRTARLAFLNTLDCQGSNRDPLSEFSERLVAVLVDGRLAESRVQRGFDVIGPAGEKIQVKYLANPGTRWINEQQINFSSDMDSYALVFFENLELISVLLFSKIGIEAVCKALNKRHPEQHISLQLTQRNFRQILDNVEIFQTHGVRLLYPTKEFAHS